MLSANPQSSPSKLGLIEFDRFSIIDLPGKPHTHTQSKHTVFLTVNKYERILLMVFRPPGYQLNLRYIYYVI